MRLRQRRAARDGGAGVAGGGGDAAAAQRGAAVRARAPARAVQHAADAVPRHRAAARAHVRFAVRACLFPSISHAPMQLVLSRRCIRDVSRAHPVQQREVLTEHTHPAQSAHVSTCSLCLTKREWRCRMLLATQCWWLAGAADWVREAIVPPAHKQVRVPTTAQWTVGNMLRWLHGILTCEQGQARSGQTLTSTAHGSS